MEKLNIKKGEKRFIKRFEGIHKEKPSLSEKEPTERVKITLENIKEEISDLPEVKSEAEFHPQIPISQVTNILAQAIQIAIEEDVSEGLKFIYQTQNPYLIDAFHDILIGHFLNLLKEQGKI